MCPLHRDIIRKTLLHVYTHSDIPKIMMIIITITISSKWHRLYSNADTSKWNFSQIFMAYKSFVDAIYISIFFFVRLSVSFIWSLYEMGVRSENEYDAEKYWNGSRDTGRQREMKRKMDKANKAQYQCIFLSVYDRVNVCLLRRMSMVGVVVLQLSLLSLFMFSKYNAFCRQMVTTND